MECGHKGRKYKKNIMVMKELTGYMVTAEYMYCNKCKKYEMTLEEKQRIKKQIDEEEKNGNK